MAKIFLIVLCCTVVALSVYLYVHLEPDVADQWSVRLWVAIKRAIKLLAVIGDTLGIASNINLTRYLNTLVHSTNPDKRVEVTDALFAGVSVRLYKPKSHTSKSLLPALVYIPGGGWTYNDIDAYNAVSSYISAEANIVVISVQYRSAPEHLFPVAFEDCVTAVVHLFRNTDRYNVDKTHVAVAGDDSGGNLAAALANRLSFESDFAPIRFHALFYPLLQAFDFNLPSYQRRKSSFSTSQTEILTQWLLYYQGHAKNLHEFLVNNHTDNLMKVSEYAAFVEENLLPEKYYIKSAAKDEKNYTRETGNTTLAQEFERVLINPYFSPLMAMEFAGFSPGFIVTTEHDPGRDDGLLYVERLKSSNVKVVHEFYPNSARAFLQTFGTFWEQSFSRVCLDNFVKYIKENL